MPRITSVKQRQLVAASPDNTKEQFLSRRIFDIGTGFSGLIERITLQTDGKFLVGGGITLFNGESIGSRFTRLNADGTLDTAFNANLGTGFNNTVRAISVQSDGKILVGGDFSTFNGNTRNRLVRLNSDGTEDTAFYANLGTAFNNSVYSTALQPDGGIIVVGLFTTFNGNTRNRLVRLNANGTEDTAFYANLGTGFGGSARAISVQSDGKIVVGGFFTTLNGVTRNRLVRFNSDGTEDTAFYTNLGTAFNDIVDSTVLQPDGKILAVGQFTQLNGTTRNYLVRLNSDGTEDTEFNNNLGAGFSTPVRATSVQSDGKILVGGIFTVLNNVLFGVIRNRLVRLNADGTEDTAFYTNLGTAFNNTVYSIVLQPDGKILVGGQFTQLNGATYGSFVRLDSRGIADIASIPAASYTVTPAANNINEGSALTFTATTANVGNGTVLGWRVIDRPEDFATNTGVVTITSNTGTITVTPTADLLTEGAETFRVEITKITGTTLATSAAVTINDTSASTFSITSDVAAVDEGSSVTFTVSVDSQNIPDGFTLYWTVDSAADVTASSGSFEINSDQAQFTVTAAEDFLTEGEETFTVSVRSESVAGPVVATSDPITVNDTSLSIGGQQAYTTPGTYEWIVPTGVTTVSVVAVGGGGGGGGLGTTVGGDGGDSSFGAFLTAGGGQGARDVDGGNALGGTGSTIGGDIGGGNGGQGGLRNTGDPAYDAGGGGAGGYSGNGGAGANVPPSGTGVGSAGSGGGGGGGRSANHGAGGGGVGLLGEGASGAGGGLFNAAGGGSGGEDGGANSGLRQFTGGRYGGGSSGSGNYDNGGGGGGGLRWRNNISVTPGESITVIVGAGGLAGGVDSRDGAEGAVRIIWGPGRAFPSTNTADV